MEKKFEVGQLWENHNGRKAIICEVLENEVLAYDYYMQTVRSYHKDGELAISGCKGFGLIKPWQEPRSGEVWVNVYSVFDDGAIDFKVFDTLENAKLHCKDPIARIKMPWKEGEFHD